MWLYVHFLSSTFFFLSIFTFCKNIVVQVKKEKEITCICVRVCVNIIVKDLPLILAATITPVEKPNQ